MNRIFRIGVIGCDTSHCSRFSALLRGGEGPGILAGSEVVMACAGEGEEERLQRFTAEMEALGVPFVSTPEEVAAACDGVMILSADGGVHPALFRRIAREGLPVFIDKPLALSSAGAEEILRCAEAKAVPVFSASALRYSRPLTALLEQTGEPVGIEVSAPATWLTPEQGLFYYGIHGIEMLFAALGPECHRVSAFSNDRFDLCTGEWEGGRFGVFRGNRTGNKRFSAQIHTSGETYPLGSAIPEEEPIYIPLLEKVVPFLRSGVPPVGPVEMQRVIRFIEAAAESAATGRVVRI